MQVTSGSATNDRGNTRRATSSVLPPIGEDADELLVGGLVHDDGVDTPVAGSGRRRRRRTICGVSQSWVVQPEVANQVGEPVEHLLANPPLVRRSGPRQSRASRTSSTDDGRWTYAAVEQRDRHACPEREDAVTLASGAALDMLRRASGTTRRGCGRPRDELPVRLHARMMRRAAASDGGRPRSGSRLGIGRRSSAVTVAAGGACTATGSTSQTSDSRSWRSARRRAASAEPASRWSATRRRNSADARRAVLAVPGGSGEADRVHAPRVERGHVAAVGVVQVGPAAGHPRPEVGADGAEYDDDPAGHVFAAVLAEALDDRLRAGVAHGEPHPGPADEVQPAAGRAVQAGVAGDRLAGGVGGEVRLRGDDEPPARQALADVVVRLADQPQLERRPRERPERLAGRAAELQADRPAELAALERARQRRAERPVGGREPEAAGREARPGRRARRRGSSRAATPAGGGRRGRRARASRAARRRHPTAPRQRPRRDPASGRRTGAAPAGAGSPRRPRRRIGRRRRPAPVGSPRPGRARTARPPRACR